MILASLVCIFASAPFAVAAVAGIMFGLWPPYQLHGLVAIASALLVAACALLGQRPLGVVLAAACALNAYFWWHRGGGGGTRRRLRSLRRRFTPVRRSTPVTAS